MTTLLAVFLDRPWPGRTGDMQRVRALLDAAKQAAVDVNVVLCPAADAPPGAPPNDMNVTEFVRAPSSMSRAIGRFVRGLPSYRPPMMAFYNDPSTRSRLAEHVRTVAPDLVLTHHLGGASLLAGIVEPERILLDLPNDEAQRFARLAATATGAKRFRFEADHGLTKRWVARELAAYRAVTVVSDDDAASYRARAPGASIVVVPNGTTPPPQPRPDPSTRDVMFLGDLDYPPNRDGISWFVREVLPSCRAIDELRAVGRGTAPRADRVTPVGFVDDVAGEFARAAAMVVPLHAGGGTRLKVLDAFGHGVPVISTALGVEGLGAVPGVHYVAAETPREWIDATDRVLGDRDLRERLARAARALVLDRFNWPIATRPLVDLLRGLGEFRGARP